MKRIGFCLTVLGLIVGCNDAGKQETAGATTGGATAQPAAAQGGNSTAAATPWTRPTGDGADAAVQDLLDAYVEDRFGDMWDMLPEKHRADLKQMIAEVAGQLDPEVYDRTFALTGKLLTTLKQKKSLITAGKAWQMVPPEEQPRILAHWDGALALAERVANSEIRTIAGLKALDLDSYIKKTGFPAIVDGRKLAESAFPTLKVENSLRRRQKVTLVSNSGDRAVVRVEYLEPRAGDPPAEDVACIKLDGKWIAEDLTKSWDAGLADAKAELTRYAGEVNRRKPELLKAIAAVDGVLDQLLAAPDQQAFDSVVDSAPLALLPAIAPLMADGPTAGTGQTGSGAVTTGQAPAGATGIRK